MGQTTPAVELGLHFHVSHTPVEFRDCILYSNEAFILTNGCLPFVKGEVFCSSMTDRLERKRVPAILIINEAHIKFRKL